jgi:Epoxide hydrolase N terminus
MDQFRLVSLACQRPSGGYKKICSGLNKQSNRRKTENRLNSFTHFTADIVDDDGTKYDIHFAALFSKKPDAIPLMMLHGWPGTEVSYSESKIIQPLLTS